MLRKKIYYVDFTEGRHRAFLVYVEKQIKNGTQTIKDFCLKLGISRPAYYKMIKSPQSIKFETWIILEDIIRPYLDYNDWLVVEEREKAPQISLETENNELKRQLESSERRMRYFKMQLKKSHTIIRRFKETISRFENNDDGFDEIIDQSRSILVEHKEDAAKIQEKLASVISGLTNEPDNFLVFFNTLEDKLKSLSELYLDWDNLLNTKKEDIIDITLILNEIEDLQETITKKIKSVNTEITDYKEGLGPLFAGASREFFWKYGPYRHGE